VTEPKDTEKDPRDLSDDEVEGLIRDTLYGEDASATENPPGQGG